MAGFGIAIGFFVFLLTGAFISEVIVHEQGAGFFPGIVLGIWAARPFIHEARIQRYNFLHPAPREYRVPLKQAFSRVRDLLAEVSYNFGDRWQVLTADTQTGRIRASLRFIDEEVHLDADSRGQMFTRKERFQRFITLDVLLTATPTDSTMVQLDFSPKVEGANFFACDSIVSGIQNAIERELGPGEPTGTDSDTALSAPPWWLIAASGLALLSLWASVMKAVFS